MDGLFGLLVAVVIVVVFVVVVAVVVVDVDAWCLEFTRRSP